MNRTSRQAIDAYSASPALRLRSRVLSAKAAQRPPLAVPPDVRHSSTSLGLGLAAQPSHRARLAGDPRADLMRLREEAADEIDRLLIFLDATEGDTDCEDTDQDGEEPEHDEDAGDREPVLGSVNPTEFGDQARWAGGGADDREDEHDGSEPSLCGTNVMCIIDDRDLEADLGSFDRMIDQTKAGRLADLRYHTMGGWPVSHGEFDDVRPVS